MAALISSVMNTKDKVPFFVNRCEEMDIEVLPPDVNSSDHDFVVSEKAIRFGLDAVKNVGYAAVEAILRAREDGEIKSIWDFCERVDARAVNKRAIECLVKCGALDSTGATRRGMLEVLPAAQSAGQKVQEDAQMGQGSIFDFGDAGDSAGEGASGGHHRPPISANEFDRSELLALEKETLGTYLSSHPLSEVRDALRARVDCSLAELSGKPDGAWVTLGGIVTTCKKVRTKSGNQLLFATLDDIEGQIEMLVFKAEESGATAAAIAPDTVVLVRGRLDHKEGGETKLVVQEAQRFEPGSEEIARATAVANAPMEPLKLTIDAAMLKNPALVDELKSVFEHHKGEAEVHLAIRSADGNSRQIKLGKDYRVRPSSGLRAELGHVLGSDALAA
jgi:DNA polymerase-3 subunit alpha